MIIEESMRNKYRMKARYQRYIPFLPPADITCWVVLAALSGIIGGASWEVVRKVIRKITGDSKKITDDIGQTRIQVNNSKDINVFIKYIKEYHYDKVTAPEEVKYHMAKEKMIDRMGKVTLPIVERYGSKGLPSQEEFTKEVAKAFDEYEDVRKPNGEDFDSFWKDV